MDRRPHHCAALDRNPAHPRRPFLGSVVVDRSGFSRPDLLTFISSGLKRAPPLVSRASPLSVELPRLSIQPPHALAWISLARECHPRAGAPPLSGA
ncbi:hypothetical protein SLA2020_441430 [Shorea laevis]